jgi:hypothetical protein
MAQTWKSGKNYWIKAYPNPFSEAVNFEIESPAEQRMTLEIFDLSGRRLYLHTDILLQGGNLLRPSNLRLPGSGAFIYKITAKEEVNWGKIVRME